MVAANIRCGIAARGLERIGSNLNTMTGGLHITCPQLLTDIVKIRGDPQHGFKSQRDLVISGSSLWFTDIKTHSKREKENLAANSIHKI